MTRLRSDVDCTPSLDRPRVEFSGLIHGDGLAASPGFSRDRRLVADSAVWALLVVIWRQASTFLQALFSGHVHQLLRRGIGPGQQFVDLAVEMAVDDLCEDIGHPGIRIDAVQFAGLDERNDDRPVFSAAVGTREERVLAIESDRTDCALNDIGVDLDAAVVNKEGQAVPKRQRVADRLGDFGLLPVS